MITLRTQVADLLARMEGAAKESKELRRQLEEQARDDKGSGQLKRQLELLEETLRRERDTVQ